MRTEDRLRRFLSERLQVDVTPVTDDFPLIENGVIDSLGIFEIVQYIEDEFSVTIEDEDLVVDNFGTLGDMARLIGARTPT